MKKKIPRGWMDYLPFGGKVEGTKLFPFKTPLKLEMQSNIPKSNRFTPACLIANVPELKAVIDLTDTDSKADRYYSPKEFLDSNVEHLKIRIYGGGVVPGQNYVKMFSDAVDGLLEKYANDPDALIGVHCTHGLNRTGYFICMYMVTRMGINPIEAIDKFQKARGYEMYRQNFIEEIIEPGKHSLASQKPNFCKDLKLVKQVGNYSYDNNWLETNSRKPFRGFNDHEIQNTEFRRKRNDGTRSWRPQNDFSRGREAASRGMGQRASFSMACQPPGGESSGGSASGCERLPFEESKGWRPPFDRVRGPRNPWRIPMNFRADPGGAPVGSLPYEHNYKREIPQCSSLPNQHMRVPIEGEKPTQSETEAVPPRCIYPIRNPWRSSGDDRGTNWQDMSRRGGTQGIPSRAGGYRGYSRDHLIDTPFDGRSIEDPSSRGRREGYRGGRRGKRPT